MTERACLPEPPCDCFYRDRVAGLGLPVGGERGVVLMVELARRVVGDIEERHVGGMRCDREHRRGEECEGAREADWIHDAWRPDRRFEWSGIVGSLDPVRQRTIRTVLIRSALIIGRMSSPLA